MSRKALVVIDIQNVGMYYAVGLSAMGIVRFKYDSGNKKAAAPGNDSR